MADALTNNYSLVQPQVGGDSGTWGGILNNGMIGVVDAVLGANFSTSVTSLDVTLTTTQFQNAIFVVNGTATGNHSLIVPFSANSTTVACGGKFVVVNNQTGAFNLSVKTAAGGGSAVVPQGFAAELYSDGTNVSYAANGLPGYAQGINGNPNGQLAGTAGSVNTNASIAFDYADGILYLCTTSGTSGSAVWSQPTFVIPRGFDTAVNLSFTTSVSANVLTVTALAANTQTTPTALNPIIIPFRDSTVANGDIITVNVTGSLSISTFSTGASLGAQNNAAFRFWIVGFNNSGAAVLGLINCAGVNALNEAALANTIGMTSGATSTGVFYTPNGISLSSKAFRILGFLSYESGLVTAGTYNNPPTVVQLFGPGIKKPGDTIQGPVIASVSTSQLIASTSFVATPIVQSITPTSAANSIYATADVNLTGTSVQVFLQCGRNSAANVFGDISAPGFGGNASSTVPVSGLDAPSTTVAVSYAVYAKALSPNAASINSVSGCVSNIRLWEIMG